MDLTLVVLAAGMGSRFGGLKQIEPFGPNGEFILDYSIYDALQAGFNKVVFIIKRENLDIFKDTIGKRIESKIKTEYAFQELNDVPEGVIIPNSRTKPLGTAHAIYAAREKIDSPFLIINADDFYGRESFKIAADYLRNNNDNCTIGYRVKNTINDKTVKRGVIYKDSNDNLLNINECSITREEHGYLCEPLDGSNSFIIDENSLVSMNMFGLNVDLIDYLKEHIKLFFKDNNDLETCEYLLPNLVTDYKNSLNKNIKVLDTPSIWHGVTYKEDKDDVVNSINKMIDDGKYPNNLWQ